MMRVCILMGSPRPAGNTAELCKPFIAELEHLGAEVAYIFLGDKVIHPCKGCYACQEVTGAYGCVHRDHMAEIVAAVCRADLLVLATPIYIWYCPSQMKAVLDRFFGMNKLYRSGTGSLWGAKPLALLVTQGYDAAFGAGPFEAGIRSFCTHAGLVYRGMHTARDINDLPDFKTPEAIAGAKAFARQLLAAQAGPGPG